MVSSFASQAAALGDAAAQDLRVFLLHDVERLASAWSGKTIGAHAASARHDRRAQETIVERRCDHRMKRTPNQSDHDD
jgi:hypothetical protein